VLSLVLGDLRDTAADPVGETSILEVLSGELVKVPESVSKACLFWKRRLHTCDRNSFRGARGSRRTEGCHCWDEHLSQVDASTADLRVRDGTLGRRGIDGSCSEESCGDDKLHHAGLR
jgi:hypothetical protein